MATLDNGSGAANGYFLHPYPVAGHIGNQHISGGSGGCSKNNNSRLVCRIGLNAEALAYLFFNSGGRRQIQTCCVFEIEINHHHHLIIAGEAKPYGLRSIVDITRLVNQPFFQGNGQEVIPVTDGWVLVIIYFIQTAGHALCSDTGCIKYVLTATAICIPFIDVVVGAVFMGMGCYAPKKNFIVIASIINRLIESVLIPVIRDINIIVHRQL